MGVYIHVCVFGGLAEAQELMRAVQDACVRQGVGSMASAFQTRLAGGRLQVGCVRQATRSDLWRCQLVWPWVEPTNLSTFKSFLSGASACARSGGFGGVRSGGDGLNC